VIDRTAVQIQFPGDFFRPDSAAAADQGTDLPLTLFCQIRHAD
jgi:hypothetical protein